jgi:hypothetical protein
MWYLFYLCLMAQNVTFNTHVYQDERSVLCEAMLMVFLSHKICTCPTPGGFQDLALSL